MFEFDFVGLEGSDVYQHHPTLLSVFVHAGVDFYVDDLDLDAQRKLEIRFTLTSKYLRQKCFENRPAGLGLPRAQALACQVGALAVQQLRGGQVGLCDDPGAVKGEVAHGGEFVQIGVEGGRLFCRVAPIFQLFVLHLQLDLTHLQFVQQARGIST